MASKQMPQIGTSLTDPDKEMLEFTTAINQIAANTPEVNPYEVRNAILLKEKKARVRYRNGITLPVSAELLLANAMRQDYNHRRTLSRNIIANSSQPRPVNASSHHIVALSAVAAKRSRDKLFGWGIGINDADNGVFLPRSALSKLVSYPNASIHGPIHTVLYHAAVFRALQQVPATHSQVGRIALRGIKSELLQGTFPW